MIGAEAIRDMLKALDLRSCGRPARRDRGVDSELKPKKLAKRLKLIEAFMQSHKPEWMILTRCR